uniref:Uncharacterized protein n=1 Tax=Romanomermis culicivorax TaxID=13658 RepID=A0A915HLK7_ROMCU
MLEFVCQKVQKFDNLQRETQKCFLDTNVATRGESCEIKKLSIFRDELWLPHFMDNLHNWDPEYGEKFGLKVVLLAKQYFEIGLILFDK